MFSATLILSQMLSNTLWTGTLASVFCIHRKAVQTPVSFTLFPHAKHQCIFGCHKVDPWRNIDLHSWNWARTFLFILWNKKEVGRANPETFTDGRKTLVLIDTSSVCVHHKTASENVSKPQLYCSEVTVLIGKYATWFFVPPDTVISLMDMEHSRGRSSWCCCVQGQSVGKWNSYKMEKWLKHCTVCLSPKQSYCTHFPSQNCCLGEVMNYHCHKP